MKSTATKHTRVIVNGRIPLQSDRDALCQWALTLRAELIGSKYATVRWGRGGGHRFLPRRVINLAFDQQCKDAGVRLEQGNMIVLETYRAKELRRVPLAEVVLDVVKAMRPPGVESWTLDDATALLAYCDYLDENEHSKAARVLRRWAEEVTNPAPADTRHRNYHRPRPVRSVRKR